MANCIRIHERNGKYFIDKVYNGKRYKLTYGAVGNLSDLAYMQMVVSISLDRINKGTFSGFDEWKVNRIKPIDKKDLIKALLEKGTQSALSIITHLEKYPKDVSSAKQMKEFFNSLTISSNSKNRYLSDLRMIAPTYCEGLSFSKAKGDPDPFNASCVELILSHLSVHYPEHYFLFCLWFDTGMRNGELAALTVSDFEKGFKKVRVSKSRMRNGTIKGTKTDRPRTVPLSSDITQLCDRHLTNHSPDEQLFPQLNSESNLIKRVWKPTLKALGIRERKLYCIRHTAISRKCKEYKGDIAKVARESGNSAEVISKHYLGLYD